MRRLAATLLAGSMLAAPALGQAIELTADPQVSEEGYFSLSWTAPAEGATVTLEESADADFSSSRTIYRGADSATVVSGRLDGVYHYRARAGDGPWSRPVTVTVRHHSLAQAFTFLGVGAVVFLATAALIVGGHRRHRREMAAAELGGER